MAVPVPHEVAITTMAAPGTGLNATFPDNMATGDLLVAQVWAGGTFTTPDGWEQIRAQGESTFGSGETRTYWHQVDGSEGPTVPFTWTDNMYGNCAMVRVTGHNPLNPINVSAGAAGPNSATQTAPSVTTDVADCLILRCLATDRIAVTPVGDPAGHTPLWDFNGGVSFDASASAAATIGQPTAGASGTAAFTLATGRPCAIQTIAIAGATGGGGFDLGTGTVTSRSVAGGSLGLAMAESGTAASRSAAAGALGLAMGQSGTVASHSTVNGALRLAMAESGTVLSHSAINGALSVSIGLSGNVASLSAIAPAVLRLAMAESGTVLSHSAAAGALRLAMGLTASTISISELTGDLTVGDDLSGTVASRSVLTGALSMTMRMTGAAASRSALAGNLRMAMGLAGTVTSESFLTGNLTVGGEPVYGATGIVDVTPLLFLRDISTSLELQ